MASLAELLQIGSIAWLLTVSGGLPLGIWRYLVQQLPPDNTPHFSGWLLALLQAMMTIPITALGILLTASWQLVLPWRLGQSIPLAMLLIPLFAKMIHTALRRVDTGLVRTCLALGASRWQLWCWVMLPESLKALCWAALVLIPGLVIYWGLSKLIYHQLLDFMTQAAQLNHHQNSQLLICTGVTLLALYAVPQISCILVRRLPG